MMLDKRDTNAEEALDAPGVDDQIVAGSLHDLSRMGRVLGWTRLAVREVAQVVTQQRLQTFSVLDVGTGAANIPIALARWARQQQREAQFTASDISDQMLAVASANCASFPKSTWSTRTRLRSTMPISHLIWCSARVCCTIFRQRKRKRC